MTCPPWCASKHEYDGRPVHMRQFELDARCWVTAVYSEGVPGIDEDQMSVWVHLVGHKTAKLDPREAMNLALILKTRTTSPGVCRLASVLHRTGELLVGLMPKDQE
jgi:hypothetical protein